MHDIIHRLRYHMLQSFLDRLLRHRLFLRLPPQMMRALAR
jgi:hypothetical protein